MDNILNHLSFYIVIIISILLVLLTKKRLAPSQPLNLPPSPPRWPIIGNLHQLGRTLHRSLGSLSTEHGPLMLLKLGQTPTLVVSCPNVVMQIARSHDAAFFDRPKTTATDVLFYGGRNMAFSRYGKLWRESRKITSLQLLSAKSVASFAPVRAETVRAMIGSVRKFQKAINLSEVVDSASKEIVSKCLLGRNYQSSGRRLEELLNRSTALLMEVSIGDLFPCFGWVDVARGFVRRLRSTSRALDEFYNEVIQDHVDSDPNGRIKDFVDVLLQLEFDIMADMDGLTHHQFVKTMIQDMLMAGIETSSTVACWTMAELLKNPKAMKKLQDEIRRVVGNKDSIETKDIDKIDYFKCVIKEVLRLRPPVPLLVPRETSEAVEINGYNIPAKTRVIVNSWLIQRHPNWWDLPEEFNPERFENSSIDFKSHESFQYIPFGFGKRICPGMTFGMVNVQCIVANLLYWFDWKLLTSPEELDMTESFGAVVHKKNPIYAIPIPYGRS